MTLAIDFDNTWTADPVLFSALALLAQPLGTHKVIIATSRHPENSPITQEERDRHRLLHWIPVIYCHGTYKQTACEKAGYKVDIWIDDCPGMIQPCKMLNEDM
jgi:NAD-dependent SIR2 family protein deacetylase